MKKFLIFFILFYQSVLVACTICSVEVPQVFINSEITSKNDKTHFKVTWSFHKEFTAALTQYDLNENEKFEEDEKLMIKESLLDYLDRFHYLTNIEYKHKNKQTKPQYIEEITPTSSELLFTDEGMKFYYIFDLPFILENEHNLFIGFYDEGGNFDFTLQDIILKNYPHAYTLSKNLISATIQLNDPTIKKAQAIVIDEEIKIQEILPLNENIIIEKKTYLEILSAKLNELKENLKLILKDIKENNSLLSYMWLLFFSFLYGILHAIGPGHGKTLVSSYFLQKDSSYLKAFSVSGLIGVVHTFSAFILTLVVYHSIGFIFNSTIANVEQISTKVSAVIIIGIALYLLYKKIYKKTQSTMSFSTINSSSNSNITIPKVTHSQSLQCGCNSCKTTGTDLGVILAAGIIPCPGTVTIFLFTMGLGIYFVGFLSAIFMSLGMSLIIFITAIISVKIRHTTSTNNTLLKVLEYASLCFILFLGVLLLTIS